MNFKLVMLPAQTATTRQWAARLASAGTGARVVVAAPELTGSLHAQVEDGHVAWLAGRFEPAQLEGMVLAIAATDRRSTAR